MDRKQFKILNESAGSKIIDDYHDRGLFHRSDDRWMRQLEIRQMHYFLIKIKTSIQTSSYLG